MHFQTCSEWDAWLAKDHQSDSGIWVKIVKKESLIYQNARK
jgi:hypothetical protein